MADYTDYLELAQKLYVGYYGRPADPDGLRWWADVLVKADADGNLDGDDVISLLPPFVDSPEADALYGDFDGNPEAAVRAVYENLYGREASESEVTYWLDAIESGGAPASVTLWYMIRGAQGSDLDTLNNKVAAADQFTNAVAQLDNGDYAGDTDAAVAREWLLDVTYLDSTIPSVEDTTAFVDASYEEGPDTTFNIATEEAAGAQAMRITGDQDVRIDFTDPDNQVVGLDLDGDGVIEHDGAENAITGVAADYEIIDAYSRDPLDWTNTTDNFLGDIAYDGTGWEGDGVNTDGNIFLGGLGADTALGGIGNDFMAGGGVAESWRDLDGDGLVDGYYYDYEWYYDDANDELFYDELYGGRNADFFFAELSRLDATDGNTLYINGGRTSDDAAVADNTPQDSDWLLLQVSDDEDGAEVNLYSDSDDGADQWVYTVEGSYLYMDEIEHIDASGNLYGFLDDLTAVALGGSTDNTMSIEVTPGVFEEQNVGIGSSSQLEIIGSLADNILIGGYDNDRIYGESGDDLIMGGNLNFLNNPNLMNIPDNGMDELYGGSGDDAIVFEADGGIIDGGLELIDEDVYDYGDDTLYVTREALGTQTADEMLLDGVLRFELQNGDDGGSEFIVTNPETGDGYWLEYGPDGNDQFAGYGGADVDLTQDQTNYVDEGSRVEMVGMDNVIATGMGAVDYYAAGSNNPELLFNNQQNHFGYDGDLDLRGTTDSNTLYANTGDDVIEGREGGTITYNGAGKIISDDRDRLSGGDGRDDFYFSLDGNASEDNEGLGYSDGDGVDVIWRQADANGDNWWDTYSGTGSNPVSGDGWAYAQDFGIGEDTEEGASYLRVDFNNSDLSLPGVAVTQFDITVDGVLFSGGTSAVLSAFTSIADLADYLNGVFSAQDATMSVTDNGDTIVVTKSGGGVFGTDITSGTIVAGVATNGLLETEITATDEADVVNPDRLIFKAYEDRSDNEGVDDDAVTGSSITLGVDAYAEDLVADFAADGTRLAEDQQYALYFDNLTTEDIVTINVNGVTYTLQVGVGIDGSQINDEDGVFDSQGSIQDAFLGRMCAFINSFMDDDTAAGSISATYGDDGHTIYLSQNAYSGEETVFMVLPTVDMQNKSGGEKPSVTVTNVSDTEIFLYQYDGINNDTERLSEDNVLFIGEEGYSRSIIATAKEDGGVLNGSDALVINGGADDLIGIDHNLATDDELFTDTDDNSKTAETNGNFVVHGDDYLIGGDGDDIISGGTGDDRIEGSMGEDVVDGGKDLYAVREVGETQYAVEVLNAYEADERNADPDVYHMYLLEQSEYQEEMIDGINFEPYFDDTLIFEQRDFQPGVTEFTVNLNNFEVGDGEILLPDGGAGEVYVDLDADGDTDATTVFTNFENVRTVSGVGNAVADDGQGNDTLILTSISDETDGAWYSLTNDPVWGGLVEAGFYEYFDVDGDGEEGELDVVGEIVDNWDDVIYVDGVENVIGGLGDDGVDIDETEAAKNNYIDLGDENLWYDWVQYENEFEDEEGNVDPDVEPSVTIVVESATETDEVIMTAGRVGKTVATDTLVDVEFIGLYDNTAEGRLENDLLDVTNVSTDVEIDYDDAFWNDIFSDYWDAAIGTVLTDHNGDGDMSDPGEWLVSIDELYNIENVETAGGDDTVIVGDADIMSLNERSDDDSADLIIDTYLNMDFFDDEGDRETVADMRANGEWWNEIPEARNFAQFNFDLNGGVDRVDYSQTDDQIAAVVAVADDEDPDYVLVNGGDIDDGYDDAGDRVDALYNVEEIVASTNESILDFTTMDQDVRVEFLFDDSNIYADLDRLEDYVRISDGDANEIQGIPDFVEYWDVDNNDDVDPFANAAWTRIEGSDFGEAVFYDGSEDLVNLYGVDHRFTDDELNLRGGDNNVSYYKLETSIAAAITVTAWDDEEDLSDQSVDSGIIDATILFQDGSMNLLPGSGTHTITSYTGDNEVAAGTLKLEASQDAEDSVIFENMSDLTIILGQSPGVIDVWLGDLYAMRLTGFEYMMDAASDDIYDLANLNNIEDDIILVDNVDADYDTAKVYDDVLDWMEDQGANPGEIDLTYLNENLSEDNIAAAWTGFDFNALDITAVTEDHLVVLGDANAGAAGRDGYNDGGTGDDLIVGDLGLIDDVQDFDWIVFTAASIASNGSEYVLDLDNGELEDDTAAIFTTNAYGLDFSRIATDVTASLLDDGGVGGTLIGGEGDDILTGGAGDDWIVGGLGADILDGSFVPAEAEVHAFTLTGTILDGGADDFSLTFGDTTTGTINEGGEIPTGGADLDQIGNAIANFDWSLVTFDHDGDLGVVTAEVAGDDLFTVSYDALANVVSFTFDTAYGNIADDVLNLVAVNDGAGTAVAINGVSADAVAGALNPTVTAFVAQVDSADDYVYGDAAESTAASMDSVLSWDATDTFNFEAILEYGAGLAAGDYYEDSGDAAAAALFLADLEEFGFGDDLVNVFLNTDTENAMVYVDADEDGEYGAGDMAIQLVGVELADISEANFWV